MRIILRNFFSFLDKTNVLGPVVQTNDIVNVSLKFQTLISEICQ